MKSKLSALKYVRNNKKQVSIMVIIISLTFAVMYIINILFMTTLESFEVSLIEAPKKIGFVNLAPESMGFTDDDYTAEEYTARRTEIINKLKEHEGIDDAYYTQVLGSSYKGIIGNIGSLFPLLDKESIPSYLEHMGAELIEGRMPENDGEILVDSRILKNNNYTIGGNFLEGSDSFKIVGILESDTIVCAGMPNGYTNNGIYYTILCNEENSDMKKLFADIGIALTELDEVDDINTNTKNFEESVESEINGSLVGIIIIVMIFLAIAVFVAYISSMRSRMNEYCLYTSIGFSKKEVYGMMIREITLNFILGIAIGTIITALSIFGIAMLIIKPLGLFYSVFYPEQLLKIVAAFVAIIGLLQIPIAVIINNVKTIDRIEE